MAMTRWDPTRELANFRDTMDRWFDRGFMPARFWREAAEGWLPIDAYQTDNDVVVKASLPGFKPDDVDISVVGDTLTIKAERKQEEEIKEEDYFHRERRYGSFARTILLPVPVQSGKAEAKFENGVLTLTLPKSEEIKPRQIKVRTKGL